MVDCVVGAARGGADRQLPVVRIAPPRGWTPLDFRSLWEYRELLMTLAARDVRVRYKQTILGVLWVVLQPLITALIFTVIFGRLANLPSDGMPYLLFSYAGIVPWNLFSQALQRSGGSLVTEASLIRKVYFPRVVIPVASTLGVLPDFAVGMIVMFALIGYYGLPLNWSLFLIVPLLLLGLLAAVGAGLWISALNVQYRDFGYMMPFILQIWMYVSPVAYSSSLIPDRWRTLYGLNPMVGFVEGFRWSLLGQGSFSLELLAPGTAIAALVLVGGAFVFRRVERTFADVV